MTESLFLKKTHVLCYLAVFLATIKYTYFTYIHIYTLVTLHVWLIFTSALA